MRAAIYARVSKGDQDCQVQLRELREYCKRQGWTEPREFVDQAVSTRRKSRPALEDLLQLSRAGMVDCIVVWKLDRFGRSMLDLTQLLAGLDQLGVRFISASQGIDTDRSNPSSRFLLHILSAVAEFERELIRERTLSGVAAARAKGKTLGRPKVIVSLDEVERLRGQGLSWRAVSRFMKVPVITLRRRVGAA